MFKHIVFSGLLLVALVGRVLPAVAADQMALADGKLVLTMPEKWQKKTPRSRIVEFEYEIPAVEGDENPGRLTVMGAGGSVEDNINRWAGQFELKEGAKDKVKKEETKVAGQQVYLVDIAGTYKDTPPGAGPFTGAKPILRENYRMLAAIIATEKDGRYFVKLYGPKATIDKNEESFKSMIDSLKVK
jgi:hypothetical protein